jgi:hypothetical protein
MAVDGDGPDADPDLEQGGVGQPGRRPQALA